MAAKKESPPGSFSYAIALVQGRDEVHQCNKRGCAMISRSPIFFRHCEERSDEAIQLSLLQRSWIASLRSQ